MMWAYVLLGVLAATQADAKKQAQPPVQELEVNAGRTSPAMVCQAVASDGPISWKVGKQELKSGVLEEKWEDLTDSRYELSKESSELTVTKVTYDDRANYKCQFKRNVTTTQTVTVGNSTTSVNATSTVDRAFYFRLRVRDPNGAVWPTVGIAVEALVVFIIISAFEYVARNKSESK